jgi:Flp pilus assembly protein CpaB
MLPSFSVAIMLSAGSLLAQTPAFEVASVKPSEPITPAMVASGKLHAGMKIDGKRVSISETSGSCS